MSYFGLIASAAVRRTLQCRGIPKHAIGWGGHRSQSTSSDPYSSERDLLSVAPGATPEELQAGYTSAVAVAKVSSPGPLLRVKLAELGAALRTLSNVWTEEQLRDIGTRAGAPPSSSGAPSGTSFSNDLGLSSFAGDLDGADASKESQAKVEGDARAYRAMAAAKAYASMKKPGGASGSSGSGGLMRDADMETPQGGGDAEGRKPPPEWVVLGREIDATWKQAVEGLRGSGGADAAAEARFRSLVEVVNIDIERYNYMVPLARFQRGKKREALLAKELEAARSAAIDGSSSGQGKGDIAIDDGGGKA